MPTIRKSTRTHLLQGTEPQYSGGAESNTTFFAGRPRMPKDMPPLAQEKWKELAAILRKRGTLTRGDGPVLELAAITYARWRSELAELESKGTMIEIEYFANERTYTKLVINPLAKVVAQLESNLRQLYIQLGATPASRQKAKQVTQEPAKEKPKLGPDGRPLIFV